MKLRLNKGFTLIELMVVVVIIAILTSIVVSSFSQAKARSRDAKRISDLAQIQLALELAFDKCNIYPTFGTVNNRRVLITSSVVNNGCINPETRANYLMSDFISSMPTDPSTGSLYLYENYQNRFDYRLMAVLETMDGVPAGGTIGNVGNITCTSHPRNYCVGPR